VKCNLFVVPSCIVVLTISACGSDKKDLAHFTFKEYEFPDSCRLETVLEGVLIKISIYVILCKEMICFETINL